MIEEAWLTCEDPQPRAEYLFGRANPRKLRLWACACGREVIPLYKNPLIGDVLDRFESVAEGGKSREDQYEHISKLQAVEEVETVGFSRAVGGITHSQWIEMVEGYEGHFALGLLHLASAQAYSAYPLAQPEGPTDPPTDPGWRSIYSAAQQKQSALARDIFGNPFCLVKFDPEWRTSTVVALASQMYESRDFGAMPILADALQDAGCDNADILNHCRDLGPHVRGCWVVDLVLGKE